jgi:alkaline phosphatase
MKMLRISILFILITGIFTDVFSQLREGTSPRAKYVFLFIGDGMGLAQVNATEAYQAAIQDKVGLEPLSFTQFPHAGLVSTYANNRLITCSAAAGTAIATGHKTNINRIGMDPEGEKPYESIGIKAKRAGYKVGIVTSVSIDHATPSVFYAHQPDRDMFFEIGMELPKSNFDFFAGGGFIAPDGTFEGKPLNLIELAKDSGYQVIKTRKEFDQLKAGAGKAIVFPPRVVSETSLPYAIDMEPGDITLPEYVGKAIEMLDNEKGFFLMVEGGKIDWAGHANDAATLIHEVQALDQAVLLAVEFYRKHPDETLIIVTADHETGGMALGNNATKYESNLDILKYQRSSEEAMIRIVDDFRANRSADTLAEFNRMLRVLENEMGLNSRQYGTLLDSAETAGLMGLFKLSVYSVNTERGIYSNYDPFISEAVMIMNKKAGISWGSTSHTGISVPVYTTGTGAELFSGTIDNTEIPKFIGNRMGVWE